MVYLKWVVMISTGTISALLPGGVPFSLSYDCYGN